MTPAQQIKMGTDSMQRGELDKARHIAEQTVKAHPRNSAAFALQAKSEADDFARFLHA